MSVFLTGIPSDLVLSVLRPSGVELGEGQQLASNPVWCRGHYPGVEAQRIVSSVCDSQQV